VVAQPSATPVPAAPTRVACGGRCGRSAERHTCSSRSHSRACGGRWGRSAERHTLLQLLPLACIRVDGVVALLSTTLACSMPQRVAWNCVASTPRHGCNALPCLCCDVDPALALAWRRQCLLSFPRYHARCSSEWHRIHAVTDAATTTVNTLPLLLVRRPLPPLPPTAVRPAERTAPNPRTSPTRAMTTASPAAVCPTAPTPLALV